MQHSVYGFKDLSVVMSHPAMGQIEINGEGAKSITFAKANDVSQHDVAADGSVMTSKIEARNGTVTIVVQQTSAANKWFTRLYNYLQTADLSEWTQISMLGTSNSMKVTHEGTGISIQKRPDAPYQSQGGEMSWTFLASELKEY